MDDRCGDCGGLGAVVVQYPVTDDEGYTYTAQRDQTCTSCNGTGRV